MIIELHGLELYGYHGVLEQEKEDGQTFWYDVELEAGEQAQVGAEALQRAARLLGWLVHDSLLRRKSLSAPGWGPPARPKRAWG